MTKLMYDSTAPAAIPADAPVVLGYGDGRYQWSAADWARFPNAVKVSIVCFPQSQGDALDVEQGCAAPGDVPGWLDRYSRPVFQVPTLYVNRANWDTVRAAVGARQVDYIVATLDGTRVLPGAAAVQYCGAAGSGDPCQSAGNYDVSLCQDYWPRSTVTQADFDTLLRGNPDFQALIWRVEALLANRVNVAGGPTVGEINQLRARLDALTNVGDPAVLAALTALKADLDGLTLKKSP